jgi:hypothetical protein
MAQMEILIAVFQLIVGAIFGQIVSRWDNWRETKGRSDLRGVWFSASHAGDGRLVFDLIDIKNSYGKFYFKNKGNDFGYDFDGWCIVENSNTISGNWRSLRAGSTAKGNILLLINPQGNLISGCYSGQDENGANFLFGWVMAKNEELLKTNLDKLSQKIIL